MDPAEIKTFDQIIKFAIENEIAAAKLYHDLAAQTNRSGTREMFTELAKQEEGHRNKLEKHGCEGLPGGGTVEVPDLKIGDYLVDVDIKPDSSYQDVLIFAMKKEDSAVQLYNDLAGHSADAGVKELFVSLANEEKKHKLRLETEYDEHVLQDN